MLKEASTMAREDFNSPELTTRIFISCCLNNTDNLLYKLVNSFLSRREIGTLLAYIIPEKTGLNSFVSADFKAYVDSDVLPFSEEFQKVYDNALEVCEDLEHEYVTSDHVLISTFLLDEEITKIFNEYRVTLALAKDNSDKLHAIARNLNEKKNNETLTRTVIRLASLGPDAPQFVMESVGNFPNSENKQALAKFTTNFSKKAADGLFTDIVGRESELSKINMVLNRKENNNVVLVGEHGVGKTKIIEGLACKLLREGADTEILSLNLSSIMAGTNLRGQLEENFIALMKELEKKDNVIVFVDNIQIYTNKRSSDNEFEPLLFKLFENNKIRCIIATTAAGYKTVFETADFSRRFQKIIVEPSSVEETVEILNGVKDGYEKFHKTTYPDEVVREIVKLSKRYIIDNNLPSSALNVMDEIGARKKIAYFFSSEVRAIEKRIEELKDKIEETSCNTNDMDLLKNYQEQLGEERMNYVNVLEKKNETPPVATIDDVYETISNNTNIPISKISASEKKTISLMHMRLKEFIVGQDEAVESIVQSIKRSRVGLFPSHRPIATFFFNGPSGCGKTLSAKILAREIFGDEKFLVRFDMSEYADKTAVNKLIGSSAGYVGYERGGALTEAIKNKRYCVLLLDEIEKAHPDIYNLFLQVLDEGFISDNIGNKIDFKNTIVIFTSNIGAKEASKAHSIGFNSNDTATRKDIINKELKRRFPPEFINRLDDVICFNELSDDNLKNIIKIEMKKLVNRLESLNIKVEYGDEVLDRLLSIVSKEKEYGARPIIRAIQSEVENKIADKIIETEEDDSNLLFKVVVENGEIVIK